MTALYVLGVRIDYVNLSEALDRIHAIVDSGKRAYAVTVNPEFILEGEIDVEFKKVLNNADVSLPDGVGLVYASWLYKLAGKIKYPIRQTIPGIDMIDHLCHHASLRGQSVYFLGGKGDVSKKTAINIQKKYPKLHIAGFFAGDGSQTGDQEIRRVLSQASARMESDISYLFVAFGHPKQEKWIARNLPHIPARFAMGVGGAFDVLSGQKPMVPWFLRRVGLDWLWRLVIEPQRFPRIWRATVIFPLHIIRSLFTT